MAAESRILVVNADDFGFTRDVNAGIIEAHRRGILTATTLMANGPAFDDAVRLSKETPALDVGVHLVLVGGQSLARPGSALPASVSALIPSLLTRKLRVLDEIRAQVERVLANGIQPTHLDTHKHTHLLPSVLEAVARLGEEYGIRWVRRPFDIPLDGSARGVPRTKRAVSRTLGIMRRQFHRKLARHGCRTTDWFAGFQITGRYGVDEVLNLLRNLPPGITEFMTHPGFCTAELRAARTRLKESREAELRALTDPRLRQAIRDLGIRLSGFGQLPR